MIAKLSKAIQEVFKAKQQSSEAEAEQEVQEIFEANQQSLESDALIIVTERVDDIGVLIGQMVKMGLPEVLDNHIPKLFPTTRFKLGMDNCYLASLHIE